MVTFRGKTVLITGASAGIGRALALQLAAQGAQLALNGRDLQTLSATAQECRALDSQVLELPADVSREDSCRQLVASTVERFGGLDVLVNNAGMTLWARFDEVSDFSTYARLMDVNYFSAVHLTAAALPHLRQTRGLLVAVASVAGLTGVPERTGYAASKHAMIGFFESLRIELTGTGVDVTIVAPDFVITELHRRAPGPDGRPRATPPRPTHGLTAEECARQVLQAMQRRKRLLITSFRGRLAQWARLMVPDLVDQLAAKAIRTRR